MKYQVAYQDFESFAPTLVITISVRAFEGWLSLEAIHTGESFYQM